jgi:hypothetical protein
MALLSEFDEIQMFFIVPGFSFGRDIEDKIGRFFISGVCMRSRSFLLSWFSFEGDIETKPAFFYI